VPWTVLDVLLTVLYVPLTVVYVPNLIAHHYHALPPILVWRLRVRG